MKAAEQRYGLLERMVHCLFDPRQAGKVDHTLHDLLAQRVFSLTCGYPDDNDAARLAGDSIHKMLLDRDPIKGLDLASQPTLSRFENFVGSKQLYRLASRWPRPSSHITPSGWAATRRVTIDLDPTGDPTHRAQKLSFFNSHYNNSCYLPMMGFVMVLCSNGVTEWLEQALQDVFSAPARQHGNPGNQRQRLVHEFWTPLLLPGSALASTRAMATLRKDEAT